MRNLVELPNQSARNEFQGWCSDVGGTPRSGDTKELCHLESGKVVFGVNNRRLFTRSDLQAPDTLSEVGFRDPDGIIRDGDTLGIKYGDVYIQGIGRNPDLF